MAPIPLQNVSPGHPRFVAGLVLIANQVNPDGTTTPVVDTTTALTLTPSGSEIVATIDPSDNRKVILTANMAPGAATVTRNVIVNTNPALPVNMHVSIPVSVSSAPDHRKVTWDPAQGGTTGDA